MQRCTIESIDVHRRGRDAWGLAILLSTAAGLRIIRGDLALASEQATEAIELSEALEDPRGVAWSLEVFAGILAADGDGGAAVRYGRSTRCWKPGRRRAFPATVGSVNVTLGPCASRLVSRRSRRSWLKDAP